MGVVIDGDAMVFDRELPAYDVDAVLDVDAVEFDSFRLGRAGMEFSFPKIGLGLFEEGSGGIEDFFIAVIYAAALLGVAEVNHQSTTSKYCTGSILRYGNRFLFCRSSSF